MSDTNRVALRVTEESEYGVTPASPTLKAVPYKAAADLGFAPETVVSDLIRSDRQVSDLILVGGSTAGGFESELAYGIHDSLLEGVMYSAWAINGASDIVATDISIDADSINTVAEDFTTLNVAKGDFIRVSGFSAAALNGVYRINGPVTSTEIPVERAAGAATESAGSSVTIEVGDTLINGVTQKSYTLERSFLDQSSVLYEYLRGMVPGTFSLTASSKSIVECAFGFTGSTQEYTESRVGSVTDESAGSFSVINASSNVGRLAEGGTAIAGTNFVTEATIEIENNLRERNAVGHLGATSIGAGEFSVTGSMNTYFDNKTMAEKVVNNTETSFSMAFTDGSGNTIIFDLPRVKFSEGSPEVSGKNEDVMLNLSYQAILDEELGYTMKVTRISA